MGHLDSRILNQMFDEHVQREAIEFFDGLS